MEASGTCTQNLFCANQKSKFATQLRFCIAKTAMHDSFIPVQYNHKVPTGLSSTPKGSGWFTHDLAQHAWQVVSLGKLVALSPTVDQYYTCTTACPVWVSGCPEPPPPFRLKCRILLHFLKIFPGNVPRTPPPPPPIEGHRCTRLCTTKQIGVRNIPLISSKE